MSTTDPQQAVAALVEGHRRFLAFVERRVGSRQDAEDILQAAFVKGLQAASDIKDQERAVAWFYRTLRNAIVDHWRARGADARAADAVARELADAVEPPPEIEAEICACYEALLPDMKPDHAEVLRQVDLGGARPVDFAAAAGITPNAAMVRLHRARAALRERLSAACRACAEHGCLDCHCAPRR